MVDHSVKPDLILVDGSSYLYRAFYALPPLTNSHGEPTGAILGVANMLRSMLDEFRPSHMAVVFDDKGRTFRDDLYAQYKAHRPPMPDDLRLQVQPLQQLVRAMGLSCLVIPGVEADDVIGTLAIQAHARGMTTLISTGDKDMAQLVCDRITLINTMNKTILDSTGVKNKFGVPPIAMIDYLALVGDSSDNIPGIPGIGPKTAVKLLNEHGTLDQITAHAGEIKGKLGENLRAHLHQLPLARQLATIRCDVTLDTTLEDLTVKSPDLQQLVSLLSQFDFKRWLNEINIELTPRQNHSAPNQLAAEYDTILEWSSLEGWLDRLRTAGIFSFDTETTGLDYMEAELVGLSVAVEPGVAAYIPLLHDYVGAPQQLPRDQVLARLKPLLEDPSCVKIGQNIKFDLSIMARYDIYLAGIDYDTMLESYVIDSNATRHDLDSLAEKYLGYRTIRFEDIAGSGVRQLTFNQIDLAQAAPYAAEDADIALRLHQALWQQLTSDDKLLHVYQDIERPLIPILSQMERHGVLINCQLLSQQSLEIDQRLTELEVTAHQLAGSAFNISSPKQIQDILFTKLGLPITERTPTGQPSTAESVLQELALDYPLPQVILEYRSYSKLKSTYTDRLPEQLNPRSGRIHTSYHQAVAATGRLSSSNPNLQNIPIRTEAGRRIRQAFIAPPHHHLVAADYSQIELRILAHLSQDPGLRAAFRDGLDVHRATAAEIFGVDVATVSDELRRRAKAINFGLVYGMSAFGLARQLGIDRNEAQHYMKRYFERFPNVNDYMERTREFARQHGFVETLFGRRLYLADIKARNTNRRQYAERAAINAPMQGTAADIIKLAMIRLAEQLRGHSDEVAMIMQVHDELVFEVRDAVLESWIPLIRDTMQQAAQLSVPLIVDIGHGANWDEAH
ncbi:MAG: DNA polymerase I [Gammaproteobacteria bacterium]|nr:DNA polymerase I [Gammaproteobacteria bacterium]